MRQEAIFEPELRRAKIRSVSVWEENDEWLLRAMRLQSAKQGRRVGRSEIINKLLIHYRKTS